jgi:integrase/recombinase XerD
MGFTRGGFNVGAALKLPAFPDTLAERILTAAKVKAIIDKEPTARNRLLLRLLYLSGLRRGEVSQLRWKNLAPRSDDDGGFVSVFGKGGRTRSVLLPAALWRDLQAMRGEADADDDPMFVGRNGAPLSAGQLWRVCKRAGVRAGVPGFSPHWMRHAGASHAIDNGAPISVVRDCLGHSSLATTSRYVHVRPGESLGRYLPTI